MKKVFRIRMYSGRAGGSNYYHHADVISTHYQTALKAAREGRVTNWRWVDRYDSCEESYREYEYLYCFPIGEGEREREPDAVSR